MRMLINHVTDWVTTSWVAIKLRLSSTRRQFVYLRRRSYGHSKRIEEEKMKNFSAIKNILLIATGIFTSGISYFSRVEDASRFSTPLALVNWSSIVVTLVTFLFFICQFIPQQLINPQSEFILQLLVRVFLKTKKSDQIIYFCIMVPINFWGIVMLL